MAAVERLFTEYAKSLDVDLKYQNFDDELAGLPGVYAAPAGELLLARMSCGEPIACVGMRRLRNKTCEMKRLYVAAGGRGLGLGRALVRRIALAAADSGYTKIVLDTLPSMHSAQSLYRAEGFSEIEPYYDTPITGTVFMARAIRPGE
ncbi:MAG: GNAT family N-acetyltransferase [Sphingomicrobium sp.]